MSATRNEREQHAAPAAAPEVSQRPYWKRMHHTWFFWVAAVAIMTAMIIYVMSIDLVLRPRGHAQPPTAAGNTP